jgi:proline dehydrogenase
MTGWQPAAIAVARSRFAKTLTQPVIRRTLLARRFFACATAEAAVSTARSLYSEFGITASLFYLGEYIDDPARAEETVAESCRAAVLLGQQALDVHVSVDYLPFGTDWWPYVMRRLGENPRNLLLVTRSLVPRTWPRP